MKWFLFNIGLATAGSFLAQHFTAFDFEKLQSILAEYEIWARANSGVIDAALKTPILIGD